MKRVLVVCLGNICRSPIGEGLLKHHAQSHGLISMSILRGLPVGTEVTTPMPAASK